MKFHMKAKKQKYNRGIAILFACLCIWLGACGITQPQNAQDTQSRETQKADETYTLADVPEYSGRPYVVLENNEPDFGEEDKKRTDAFEHYSNLDALGRCQVAYANICTELMPTEERGEIGQVRPSGWHTVKYDGVDGLYLYNRCHLIGFQLAGENANEKNLITGTRYMNVNGMLPFENEVADYVRSTDHHVLYRVTPIYSGDDLVVRGVQMEAFSVEDAGEGVCFHVFVYNVQPGITIDYATGESHESDEDTQDPQAEKTYIINTNTRKFHRKTCESVKDIQSQNRKQYKGTRERLVADGYEPCKRCNP